MQRITWNFWRPLRRKGGGEDGVDEEGGKEETMTCQGWRGDCDGGDRGAFVCASSSSCCCCCSCSCSCGRNDSGRTTQAFTSCTATATLPFGTPFLHLAAPSNAAADLSRLLAEPLAVRASSFPSKLLPGLRGLLIVDDSRAREEERRGAEVDGRGFDELLVQLLQESRIVTVGDARGVR
jgi:hypothetical protein